MIDSVSVVIPCFNSSQTLARAIDSVVNQSCKVNEILVIDDCSSDSEAVVKICDLYSSVKYIRNKKNIGLAGSRNIGIWEAESDVVTFLDADDEFHQNKIQIQLQFLTKENVVATEAEKITKLLAKRNNYALNPNPEIKIYKSVYQNLIFNRLVGSSLMAYTKTLKKINGYDSNLRSVEDFDIWLRILNEGVQIVSIKSPLYLYYDNEDSLSKNSVEIWKNILIVVKKFISYRQIKLGNPLEQIIWILLLCKEIIKAERSANLLLKKQILLDSQNLLLNKIFFLLFISLNKIKFFHLISLISFQQK